VISDLVLALNVPQFGERIRRAEALAGMIESGEFAVAYRDDGTFYGLIPSSALPPELPMLPDAHA
jgi:hypothetical protein